MSAFICAHLSLIFFLPTKCTGAWFDASWRYRRPITVTWDAEHASGTELATAEFYSNGLSLPNAEDIRVATEDGKPVPCQIFLPPQGDRIRLVFSLQKQIKKYDVYFGNPKPAAPAGGGNVKFQAGLFIETKSWNSSNPGDFATLQSQFNYSSPLLGQGMIPSPFLGYNIFGPQDQYISKITGSLFVPLDGEYSFAISVDDYAGLSIDNQPLLFARVGPSDARYHAAITLTRGPHDFLLYHLNSGGDGRFTVAWKRPDAGAYEVINREAFGTCFGSQVGALEDREKPLVADFSITNAAECFYNDRYSLKYHFGASTKPLSAASYVWDFGDGQSSAQPEVDHVYLTSGLYTARLTIHIGANAASQTNRIPVSRNYEKLLTVEEDEPAVFSRLIRNYNLSKLSASALARAVMIHLKAERLNNAMAAANELAQERTNSDPDDAVESLEAIDRELINQDRAGDAGSLWDRVPQSSSLQPRAAKRSAQIAMWWLGDFPKAEKSLQQRLPTADNSVKRILGQAMVLNNHAEAARKMLLSLPNQGPESRQSALSGASARSVEFFIRANEVEAGEEAWERWQARYPADFLEGYSALLRTRLIELRNRPQTAAKVAEAFAVAMPKSSYAPQLLDRASKLLSQSDPTRSRSLRELLKQKYPEDPLSQ